MRSRPANISLINRRLYLPRLLLSLSSKRQRQKQPQRFADVDRVTPYHFRMADHTDIAGKMAAVGIDERTWLLGKTDIASGD